MSVAPHSTHHDLAAGSNPVIQKAGTASFVQPYYCTWNSTNGQTSTLTISNPGPNTLTVGVSGAPATIMSGSKPLNGVWSIPPNCPTCDVIAFGNYLGTTVTIVNLSNPNTTCAVVAQVAG